MNKLATVKATIIRVNGTREEHDVPIKDTFDAIYKLIGCDTIDIVSQPEGKIMLVDDNGHLRAKPINMKATELYWAICRPGTTHPIVGDVAIMRRKDLR